MTRRYTPNNQRYPHTVKITRIVINDEDIFGAEEEEDLFGENESTAVTDVQESEDVVEPTVIYEGVGRSFTDTTTTGGINVDENKRKASIPVRFDKWPGENMHPMDGDTYEVWMGNVYETGMVKDCEPDNDRTIVYWELKRV